MQLHALLSLPTFREFRLIAGADGLQREVGNVDILEYEGFTQNYAVFSENDFVLTSLFFAKDDPARILPSVQQLHARGICALAVKTVFYDTLPDEVIAFCEKNGLLVLYSLAETELTQPATAIAKLLRSYDWSAADFTIGVSTCQPTHSSLHQIIRESMDANLLAQYQQTDILLYADLGIYRQLLPLSREAAFQQQLEAVTETLLAYDSRYSSSLLDTRLAYVSNHGEISPTAQQLYQHPNTIRYRIAKAKELLSPLLGPADFYEQISNLLRIYLLQQVETPHEVRFTK